MWAWENTLIQALDLLCTVFCLLVGMHACLIRTYSYTCVWAYLYRKQKLATNIVALHSRSRGALTYENTYNILFKATLVLINLQNTGMYVAQLYTRHP